MGKNQEELEDTVQQENYDSCHKGDTVGWL